MTFDPNQGRRTRVDPFPTEGDTSTSSNNSSSKTPTTTVWQATGVPYVDVFLNLLLRQFGYDRMNDAQRKRFHRRIKVAAIIVLAWFLLSALAFNGGMKGFGAIWVIFVAAIVVAVWVVPRMLRRDRKRAVAKVLR